MTYIYSNNDTGEVYKINADSETEALNYELQLQKEYWDKGQCLGCADLRRRYGYLEDEVIE